MSIPCARQSHWKGVAALAVSTKAAAEKLIAAKYHPMKTPSWMTCGVSGEVGAAHAA